MKRIRIDISGMRYDHCVESVSASLRSASGVRDMTVTIGQAIVLYDDTATGQGGLFAAVRVAGPFDVIGFGVERNPDT